METAMVPPGTLSRAKLQSDHHHQHTNTVFWQARYPSCYSTNSVKAIKWLITPSTTLPMICKLTPVLKDIKCQQQAQRKPAVFQCKNNNDCCNAAAALLTDIVRRVARCLQRLGCICLLCKAEVSQLQNGIWLSGCIQQIFRLTQTLSHIRTIHTLYVD